MSLTSGPGGPSWPAAPGSPCSPYIKENGTFLTKTIFITFKCWMYKEKRSCICILYPLKTHKYCKVVFFFNSLFLCIHIHSCIHVHIVI